jgi:uncharacterized protein YprB with RNaseH-like and TPR domain
MESLSDRLKSLGFKVASEVKSAPNKERVPLEEIISAEVLSNTQGSFLNRSSFFPSGYQHGKVIFPENITSEKVQQAARLKNSNIPLSSMIFLDTETSGLSGGSGSFAFLVGIGWFSGLGFHLHQFIIRDPSEESAMLLHLSNVIKPESVFVTFNGKSFDIPLLANRFIVNRLPASFRENAHVDVLHLSRKLWKNQLMSCALKDLEREILEMERSEEEVPGWMIPDIYFEYLRTGVADKLSNVVYHNAQDIVSLVALFIFISNLLEKNSDLDYCSSSDLFGIGKILFDMGSLDTSEKVLKKSLERSKSNIEKIDALNLLGKLLKSDQRWQNAVQYWIEAGNYGDLGACIELAMYYEHKTGEINSALFWTNRAKQLLDGYQKTAIQGNTKQNLTRRLLRLQQKAGKNV